VIEAAAAAAVSILLVVSLQLGFSVKSNSFTSFNILNVY